MARGTIDYDIDAGLEYCRGGAQDGVQKLVEDLNMLCNELDDCQDKFHCKGGDSSNAVIKIYKGFATAIGKSNGTMSGTALGGCAAQTGQIINIIYSEATIDKKAQDSSNYSL